jgi:acyl-CoA dehydrogenase
VSGPDQYVFFYADSTHPNYHLVQNVVPSQNYVSEFRLEDYPVLPEDVLHTGEAAFSAALNTVNVGKFNLCFGAIGLATHGFYESIAHAHDRVLYGKPVTAMSHVRAGFVEAYARLIAMKLFSDRAIDYFRTAGPEDRRYLLFNPVTKMKVTSQGEQVMQLLGDIVAAKGFEKDNFIAIAKYDTTCLPRLEGTVAVNLALVLKFMPAYLFQPEIFEPVLRRQDAADDDFLWRQGPARGLGKIRFHDWRAAYTSASDVPNVAVFTEQCEAFVELLMSAPPAGTQLTDLDFTLAVGELFTLIVYGQLILEQAALLDLERDVVDEIFAVLVRDFSAGVIALHGKATSTPEQQAWALGAIRKPRLDETAQDRVWQQVLNLASAYAMNP